MSPVGRQHKPRIKPGHGQHGQHSRHQAGVDVEEDFLNPCCPCCPWLRIAPYATGGGISRRAWVMRRRDFLAGVAAAVVAPRIDAAQAPALPIIDTHIHLFDPNRPQGAPYSGPKSSGPPVAALPARYRALAAPLGAVGAIKVEASPWVEDNLWVLQVAQQDPMIVAVIGNLEPEKPEFAEYLGRYRKNPLFRGIRCGNLWGRDFTAQAGMPAFIDGLKRLAEADLVMDTANPRLALLQGVAARHRPGADASGRARSPAGADAVRDGARSRRARRRAARARARARRCMSSCPRSFTVFRARSRPTSQPYRAGLDRLMESSARIASSSAATGRTATASRPSTRFSRSRPDTSRPCRGRPPRSTSGRTPSPRISGQTRPRASQPLKRYPCSRKVCIAMRMFCSSLMRRDRRRCCPRCGAEQAAAAQKPMPLFDGKTLNGWEGDLKVFRVAGRRHRCRDA